MREIQIQSLAVGPVSLTTWTIQINTKKQLQKGWTIKSLKRFSLVVIYKYDPQLLVVLKCKAVRQGTKICNCKNL